MKPVKRKRSKLKEVETKDKNVSAFLKDKKPFIFEKQVEYHKNQPGGGVLKVKFKGGKKPENNCHLVIDKPESVNLVRPPTTIINEIIQNIEASQKEMKFFSLIFSMYIFK